MRASIPIQIETYQAALDYYREQGWYVNPQTITHRDERVITHPLQRGCTGSILDIVCPAGHILLICGVLHSGIKPGDIARAPHLYTIPHQFSILCYDKDNREPSQETVIRIKKIKPSEGVFSIDTALYGDIALKTGERFKRKEERYYFTQGIILYGTEYLSLIPIQPDIDIVRTELFMKCDFLMKV